MRVQRTEQNYQSAQYRAKNPNFGMDLITRSSEEALKLAGGKKMPFVVGALGKMHTQFVHSDSFINYLKKETTPEYIKENFKALQEAFKSDPTDATIIARTVGSSHRPYIIEFYHATPEGDVYLNTLCHHLRPSLEEERYPKHIREGIIAKDTKNCVKAVSEESIKPRHERVKEMLARLRTTHEA